MLSKNVLYYGSDQPLPARQSLRAGPLSLVYEAGDLRYIRLGEREIVRRLYVAMRDRNWETIAPAISNLTIQAGEDSFQITYDVENRQGEIDFFWRGAITGDARGTISFSMDGVARSTFLRNRIGFCVLHPMRECAGAPARIEHVDGTVEACPFPRYIAPQSVIDGKINPVHPFSELRAVTHEVAPGVWAELRFAGDTFEMEDQRNWTDASFKTYSTPLRLPFPAEVQAGTRIAQSVTLTLQDERPKTKDQRRAIAAGPSSFVLRPSSQAIPLPQLGLGVASHGQPLGERELARLKALNLAHLRVDLRLAEAGYADRLRQAAAEARALGVMLEVAVFLSDAARAELGSLVALLKDSKPPIRTWLIFHGEEKSTAERWVRLARDHLAQYDPAAAIGSGTNVYFTELNRARPPIQALDLVSYSINPQVHAFDNASLVETLEAQAATVTSARQFVGALPLAISTVTLRPRFNPNATGPEPEPGPGELPSQVDVRQMSLFGAGWTVGSLKYLAESGAASVTYYETTGWRGVMETAAGSPLPELFRSLPGGVFPLYHVLAHAGEFAGGDAIPSTSSDTLAVEGLALRKDGRTRVLLANLSAEARRVVVQGLGGRVYVRQLDETNAEAAMRAPEAFRSEPGETVLAEGGAIELALRPYAIARIDSAMGNQ